MRRLIQIRRRRGTVDPITASYDAILAADPTVPVLFRLTSYRGQQVLFTNSAVTIPVEDIGDPVGGGRNAETGDALFAQTTDANRPIYGGEDRGLIYSSDRRVEVPRSNVSVDFIHQNLTGTILCAVDRANAGVFQAIAANAISTSDIGFWFRFTSGDQLQFAITDGTTPVAATTTTTYPLDNARTVYGVGVTDSQVHFYRNGVLEESVGWSPVASVSGSTRDLGIGCIGSSSSQIFAGDYAATLFWDTLIDGSVISEVTEALL